MDESRLENREPLRLVVMGAIGLGIFAIGVWVGASFFAAAPEDGPTAAVASPPALAPAPSTEPETRPTTEPRGEGEEQQSEEADEVAPAETLQEDAVPPDSTHGEYPPELYQPEFEEVTDGGPPIAGSRIALVIDDLGRSLWDLEALNALEVPVTYAVLPFEVLTREVVAEINRRDWELILHLPMEPQSGANPGPGALTSEMGPDELALATRAALAAVPGAIGLNNHMGSSLSTNEEAMRAILGVVDELDLFFLDSRTSAASVGYRLALESGVAAAERQVFLDPELSTEAIEEQFDRLLWLARDRGEAVAIGHPHEATLEVLARRVPEAVAAGYEFVSLSYLIDRASPPE